MQTHIDINVFIFNRENDIVLYIKKKINFTWKFTFEEERTIYEYVFQIENKRSLVCCKSYIQIQTWVSSH